MICIITEKATPKEIAEMEAVLGSYIKLAVDIEREILAGGGELHADCEDALIQSGSQSVNIWGADYNPNTRLVTFESLINIRPKQNNPSMEILDFEVRDRVQDIVLRLF